mgnify:FL=1
MKLKPCVRFALALFVWVLLFSVKSILIIATAVIMHETAHYLMCRRLNVKVCSIMPLPWGLTVSTPLIYNHRMQILVSAAGPACNFLLLGICLFIKHFFRIYSYDFDFFILANLADGALNLLPALPLDGGVILNSCLCVKKGLAAGFNKSLGITVVTGGIILISGIQIFIATGCNFSFAAVGFFILLNLQHERELLMCIKKRIFTGEIKSGRKIKYITVDYDCSALCLTNMITSAYSLVFLINRNGRFVGELNQEDMICSLLKCSCITVGECIEK